MRGQARISKVTHRQSGHPDDPREWGARCDECPLNGNQPVWGDGPKTPALAFVGEAPGGEEETLGIPFVGKSGELLMKWLSRVNLTRQEVWLDNSVMCRPPGNDFKGFLQKARKDAEKAHGTALSYTYTIHLGKGYQNFVCRRRHDCKWPSQHSKCEAFGETPKEDEIALGRKLLTVLRDSLKSKGVRGEDELRDAMGKYLTAHKDVVAFLHPVTACRPRLLRALKVPLCKGCGKFMRGPDDVVCTCPSPRTATWKDGTMANVTVPLGNYAMLSLLGVEGITARRGYVFDMAARRGALVGAGRSIK